MEEIIYCKTNSSQLSNYTINDNATSLSIYFDEKYSTFELDKFKKSPVNLTKITIYSPFINGKCSSNLTGNVYECLCSAINLKSLYVTMITDNANWTDFNKLPLDYVALYCHENVHNQILFPSLKHLIFHAFENAINDNPELCKNYMLKSFINKPADTVWEWSVGCNYNPILSA